MVLKYAFKLIFLKCIFEFIINSAPPTSNSVQGREKCVKDDNVNGTIIPWLRSAMSNGQGSNFTSMRESDGVIPFIGSPSQLFA